MRLVLDAHIVVWSLTGDPRLSSEVSHLISRQTEKICFSVAQIWEIEIKMAARRIPEFAGFPAGVATLGLELLPIHAADAIHAAQLPRHHAGPFDRMLIAHALAHNLTIVTHDRAFAPYSAPVMWA